jgi:glycine cleavage system protein P-like pyridoxal-binding family
MIQAVPGETIDDFCARLLQVAQQRKQVVQGQHNQHTLLARPWDTVRVVMAPWERALRHSYFGGER